jgi:hypothetical protein
MPSWSLRHIIALRYQQQLVSAMSAYIRHCVARIPSSSGFASGTAQHGEVWMLLGDARVYIPSHVLRSLLLDWLSSVDDLSSTSDFALPVLKEWLKAREACYCSKVKLLRCSTIRDIVYCLLVRFAPTTQLQFR